VPPGATGATFTIAYTALDLALRDAVLAALDEGAHDLARELLEMLQRHQSPATEGASTGEAHGAKVIDLAKRRRARGL
jgi:hypothetical protein